MGVGPGPLIAIIGLLLDGMGVIFSLRPYVIQSDKEIAYEARAILTAEWSIDHTEEEWLATAIGQTRLKQRRYARLGLYCLAGGFFLQAIGTYIWASS